MRSFVLKTSLTAAILIGALCISRPTANARDVVPVNWISPTTNNLFSVHMVSANDGWAAGGDVFPHWDGTDWRNVTTPASAVRVFMVNANDGWAVGYFGTIIRWNGVQWTIVTSPTTASLLSVFMVNANDGWAVGYGGTIIRWNGTQWSIVTSLGGEPLVSVYMVSADDGWAVGSGGMILRWTGTEWVPEFPTAILESLLIIFTSVAVILTKTTPKKAKKIMLPCKPNHSITAVHTLLFTAHTKP